MNNIEPTVGRMLYYWPAKTDQLAVGLPAGEPLAAQLAAVLPTGRLNLMVITWKGHPQSVRDVLLVQPDEPKPDGESFAAWMPFQVGQAGKTAELEQKLAQPPARKAPSKPRRRKR